MRNITNPALEKELESFNLPQKPLSQQQQENILAMAMKKAGFAADAPDNTIDIRSRHPRGFKRTFSVVAAIAVFCALGVTAVAAGPALLQMLRNQIGFFEAAPAQSTVADPADAPRGDYPATQPSLEAYNAPVGQSVTSNGVTITLDTVSMDGASMNCFFTLTGEQAVKGVLDPDDYHPNWSQLSFAQPDFSSATVNGQQAIRDCMDFYRVDDNTLKLWAHYLLPSVPQGDSITLSMQTDNALMVEGDWRFTAQLDGAGVRAGTRAVQAGTYLEGTDSPLNLTALTFGPVGGVIGSRLDENAYANADDSVANPVYGRDARTLLITDDTGKTLFASKDDTLGFGGEESYYNLTAPDAAATALTLTPVRLDEAASMAGAEIRTVTTEELKNGCKIPTSELGGFTVQNYQVKDGTITFEAVPYGWTGGECPQIIANDDGLISYVTENVTEQGGQESAVYKSALSSNTYDPLTGIYTCRLDYYAATQEQLANITSWNYHYIPGYSLDEANAVTLPLNTLS